MTDRIKGIPEEHHPATAGHHATDHGIIEFDTASDGERTGTRYADGYYPMLVDWIRDGRLKTSAYGNAERLAPR